MLKPEVIGTTGAANPGTVSTAAMIPRSEVPLIDEQLSAAAASGQSDVVKSLVRVGADVNKANETGMTPVMMAVIAGHLDTAVQLALSSGADLSREDPHGRTALAHAIAASNREVPQFAPWLRMIRPFDPLLGPAGRQRLLASGPSAAVCIVMWAPSILLVPSHMTFPSLHDDDPLPLSDATSPIP